MKHVLSVVAVLALSCSAWALDDTPENRLAQADRYIRATPPKEMFQDATEQMSKNLPPVDRQKFKDLMARHLDISALTTAMRDGMVKHFTADELKALADFYGSPVGKSAMKKFGVYMAEVMPSIQAELAKAQAKANRETSDLKTKE